MSRSRVAPSGPTTPKSARIFHSLYFWGPRRFLFVENLLTSTPSLSPEPRPPNPVNPSTPIPKSRFWTPVWNPKYTLPSPKEQRAVQSTMFFRIFGTGLEPLIHANVAKTKFNYRFAFAFSVQSGTADTCWRRQEHNEFWIFVFRYRNFVQYRFWTTDTRWRHQIRVKH